MLLSSIIVKTINTIFHFLFERMHIVPVSKKFAGVIQ